MGVLFQKKNAVRDGTLVLATKNTLCAQRQEAPCMQHAGGTNQLARILTAQNNSFLFVQTRGGGGEMYEKMFLVLYVLFQVWTLYRLKILQDGLRKRRWKRNDRDNR